MRVLGILITCAVLLAYGQANGQVSQQVLEGVRVDEQSNTLWAVNKTKSRLLFSGNQGGEVFTGSFGEFDAVIDFNPDDLAKAKVDVIINMDSAEAGDAERTDALPGKDWFYVKKFPVAKFEAADFEHLGGDKYVVKGSLTIRDIRKKLDLPFTLKIENGNAVMDAKLTLNRTAYKIGTGMWASEAWVSHDIIVNIHLEAQQNK